MKLQMQIVCMFSLLSCQTGYTGAMGDQALMSKGPVYIGVFGGGGSTTTGSLHQEGTALFPYGSGSGFIDNAGPLAVNAVGTFNRASAWLVGGRVGYRWPTQQSSYVDPTWMFTPAIEIEGYYIGGASLQGDDVNNHTARLVEHIFHVTYPLRTGVALVNAVLTADHPTLGKFHPYLGAGMGIAVISIVGANSLQTSPLEAGINHYNSDPNDAGISFAAQPKVGVNFDLSPHTSLFAEYRFLYLAASHYTFGSTSYPTHVATTDWDAKIGSQYYNMGSLGVQFDL